MKVLQIFIASSISEDTMKQDRAALSAYAERLNDRLVKEGRYLRLILCEEEDQFVAQGGKQNEIDQKLIASNAALFLVGEKLGSFTRGELEVAVEQRRLMRKPELFLRIRAGNGEAADAVKAEYASCCDLAEYSGSEELAAWLERYIGSVDWNAIPEEGTGRALKEVKFFLSVGGDDELKAESLQLGAYFRQLNDTYVRRGIYFRLFFWRGGEDGYCEAGRRVDAGREAADSEIALFLFFRSVPEGAKQELDAAYEHFKQDQTKPKILTFFRRAEGEDAYDEVKALLTHIGADIKHYYNLYEQVDSIKLAIATHIGKLGLDIADPFIHEGKIYLPGGETIDTSLLAPFAKSGALRALTKELESCRALLRTRDATQETVQREKQLIREISALETSILKDTMTMYFEMVGGSNASEQEAKAYRALSCGDYDRAEEILSPEVLEKEYATKTKLLDQSREMVQMQSTVNKMLLRIRTLRAKYAPGQKDEEIVGWYEDVAKAIRKDPSVDPSPLYDYASFLYEHDNIACALEIGKMLEGRYLDPESSAGKWQKARLWNLLGLICSKMTDKSARKKAGRYYEDALELFEELAEKEPEKYDGDVAVIFNNLGVFYDKTKRRKEAEACYLQALEIYKRLAASRPSDYEPGLAMIYNNLGLFYDDEAIRRKEAEACYQEALKHYKRLAASRPSDYEHGLAVTYNNLGFFYSKDSERRKDAEECYLQALEIRKRLAAAQPSVYEPDLADIYNNLGLFYDDEAIRRKDAEECYLKALEIRKRLAALQPTVYEPDLAMIYNNLGNFYSDEAERRKDAEACYLQALEIYKRLASAQPSVYEPNLAGTYNNLGVFYDKTKRRKDAEAYYLQALEIRKRLAAVQPSVYEPDLAMIYNNLGLFYSDEAERRKDAEACYLQALEIRKRLAAVQPSLYEPNLADIYNNLGNFYRKDAKRRKEAEKCYLQALEIRKRLAASQSSVYEPALADICNNLGNFYKDAKRRKDAEACYLQALEIRKRLAESQPSVYGSDLADIYNNLGNFYKDAKRRKEAEKCYLQALEIYKRLAESQPSVYEPGLAIVYNNLGFFYVKTKRRKDAEKYYLQALEIRNRLAAAQPSVYEPALAVSYYNYGLLIMRGRRKQAVMYLEQSFVIAQKYRETDSICAQIYKALKIFFS